MNTFVKCGVLPLLVGSAASAASPPVVKPALYPPLGEYVNGRLEEFDKIPVERKAPLRELALYVKSCVGASQPARLVFVCTHNSRRSQMCQIWADVAAAFFGQERVETFSGGTEATAFNPRAVAALQRAGLRIEKLDDTVNPRYNVRFDETDDPLICFSKVYNAPPNPQAGFCAVMTCSQADKSCPLVQGSSLRVAIPYEDPKVADDTQKETAEYDKRCQQICREMLIVFSLL
jgi:arsenate reductase